MDKFLTQYKIKQITGEVVFAGPDIIAVSEHEAQLQADGMSCYFENCKLIVIGKLICEFEDYSLN